MMLSVIIIRKMCFLFIFASTPKIHKYIFLIYIKLKNFKKQLF